MSVQACDPFKLVLDLWLKLSIGLTAIFVIYSWSLPDFNQVFTRWNLVSLVDFSKA